MGNERLFYLDSLRGIAIIFVIVQHLCAGIMRQQHIDSAWWTANILIVLSKPAVPLFIMISGGLLLSEKNEIHISTFLGKRFKKVVVPFVVWMIFYYFWSLLVLRNGNFILVELVNELLRGHSTKHLPVHLWFFPLVISLYVVTPVLKKFIDNSSKTEKLYLLFVCLLFGSLIPLVHKFSDVRLGYRSYKYLIYVFYFLLGCYLLDMSNKKKINVLGLHALCLSGFFISIYGTWSLVMSAGKFDNFWYRAASPGVVLMSMCTFLFFKYCFSRFEELRLNMALQYVGKMSFGVYLVHIMWMNIFSTGMLGYKLSVNSFHPIVSVPIMTIGVLSLSLVSIHIIQCLPFGKIIVPK